MRTVKFAVVGCGKIGPRHAEKLQGVPGAELVAVCDIIPARADAIAKKYGCKAYYSLDELLKNPDIDFVNVCTPSGLHAEHTIQALRAGKNVLCEKPMALTEADAIRMRDTAKEEGKLLFVVKQNRYNPPVKLAAQLLKEGKLGKPLFSSVNVVWNRNDDYYADDPWRGSKALAGGAAYTQASHFVDLMLMFMGEPASLYGIMRTQKQPIESDDTGVIAVTFKNGAMGSFNYTMCATEKNREGSMTLVYSQGTIKIGGQYLNTLEYFHVEGVPQPELDEREGGEANDYGTYKGSMSNHHKVFEDIVQVWNSPDSDHNLVGSDEAIATVRFIEKALQSSDAGEVVYYD